MQFIIIIILFIFQKIPVRKGFVRGISHLTGYVIRPLGERSCQLNYVTQSDPRGKYF